MEYGRKGAVHMRSKLLLAGCWACLLAAWLFAVETQAPAQGNNASASGRAQDQPITGVGIHDNFFAPGALYVLPGTTVIWVNNGRRIHTVTSAAGLWDDSGPLAPGEEFSVTFDVPGVYFYFSRPNTREFMRGKVVVRYQR